MYNAKIKEERNLFQIIREILFKEGFKFFLNLFSTREEVGMGVLKGEI